jgi:RNA polymerase sigma factor (TIGR02999 family)
MLKWFNFLASVLMGNGQITILLEQAHMGNKQVLDKVYELLYAEIRLIAGHQLKQLKTGQTITPTVLANECYLKISNNKNFRSANKQHFLNCLSLSMRGYLIDQLRAQNSAKRKAQSVNMGVTEIIGDQDVAFRLMDINLVLEKMQEINAQLTEVIQIKLLFGLTFAEMAHALQISERQVKRRWKQGKALLLSLLEDQSHERPEID